MKTLLATVTLCLAASTLPAATFTVTNTNDSGPGSLRQAILDSLAAGGSNTVAFNIASASKSIMLQSALPSANAVIDGTTQPGYAGKPLVEIDGSMIPGTLTTVCVTAARVTGLAVNRCPDYGIVAGTIDHNYIGIDVTGTTARGNGTGIQAWTASTISNNVISGNRAYGIWGSFGASGNLTISNNIIGLNAAQTAAVPNGQGLILDRTIATVAGNIIGGNTGYGLEFFYAPGGTAKGNYIGVTPDGLPVPNQVGIHVYQTGDTLIGGSAPGDGNVIAYNSVMGISVDGNSVRNRISRNSMHANGPIGIDLSSYPFDGVTPNDPLDGDAGPNGLQNYPVITRALSADGTASVQGVLDSAPNAAFTIELFSSEFCSPSGHGEGQTFLTSFGVTTDGSGHASFNVPLAGPLGNGSVVTATATDSFNNTSEFSACATVQGHGAFSFSQSQTNVGEGGGQATLTVLRSGGTVGSATVDYATASGTATAGADFTAVSGTLTFADGESSKTISVPIIDDTISEPTETFTVTLSNATGGATIGSPGTATVAIIDNDLPAVSAADVAVPEGGPGLHDVTLTLTATAPISGYVYYSTSNGTATAGSDYLPASGSVYFAGEMTKTFTVQIVGDLIPEPDEYFYVNLSSSGGFTVAPKAKVTILNDDVSFGPHSQSIAAGAHALLALEVGQPVSADQVIHVVSSDPSVAKVAAAVTLAAGTSTVGIDVTGVAHGSATITATLPPTLGGASFDAGIAVYEGASLLFNPSHVQTTPGGTQTVTASMSPAQSSPTVISLSSADPTVATVAASVTIPAGGSATFSVNGVGAGNTFLTATLPAGNGGAAITLPVSVDAPKGLSIAKISPATGPTSGGTSVALTGNGFTGNCTALFGGVPATAVVVSSPTAATAVTPQHAAGAVDVILTCGSDNVTMANAFTFVSFAHSVTGVLPSFGSIAGGTLTTISGADFQSSCWAFFDDVPARHVIVTTSTTILATAPAHAEGTAAVAVKCGGVSQSLANAFTFTKDDDPAAVITSVDPLTVSAGQSVRLTGVRFRATDRIALNGTAATILATTPDTQTVRIPELPLGKVSITLTQASGHVTTTGPIVTIVEPQPPRIDTAAPTTIASGDELDLTGSGFRPGYTFFLGATPTAIVELSYTHALIRAGRLDAGTYPIEVHNAAGNIAAVGPNVQCAAGGTSVNAVTPLCGSADGGAAVTILGNGFAAGASVTFGGVAATEVVVVDAHTITAKTPAGDPGLTRIVVTNADGTTASLTDVFRYDSPMDPDGGCAVPSRRRPVH